MKGIFSLIAFVLLGVSAFVGYKILQSPTGRLELLRHGSDEGTIGSLGSIRSALSIYYGDMEGQYPSDLAALNSGRRWLERMPNADTGFHHASAQVQLMTGEEYGAGAFSDAGGWLYVVSGSSKGLVGVNCAHSNTMNKPWISY